MKVAENGLLWLITRCVINQKSVRFKLQEAHCQLIAIVTYRLIATSLQSSHTVFEWGG